MKHALILCSGGIDSVTAAYSAQKKKYNSFTCIFCAYGQPQEQQERKAVKYHAHRLKARYVEIALPALKHLTLKQRIAPKKHGSSLANTREEGKQWFIPARNTLLIAHALAYAESQFATNEAIHLYLGFKNEAEDPFPDTTKEYTKRMQKLLKRASKQSITLKTPLSTKDKEDIITQGTKQGIEYATTWSCYQPQEEKHCGVCLACRLRQAGFKWAGIADPTPYATTK
jgi:7-cyano-7-deazaguanine synthase